MSRFLDILGMTIDFGLAAAIGWVLWKILTGKPEPKIQYVIVDTEATS